MGFFDDEAPAAAPTPDTDLSGPVPTGEEAQEFFAENQGEEVVEEAPVEEAPATPEQDVFAEAPEEPTSQVPIADLLLERRRRQNMESELQEQKQTLAVMNERIMNAQRMQQMQQMQEQRQRQAEENPPPDPDEDPIGAANHKIELLQQQLQNVARHTAQQQQMAQQQAQHQEQEAVVTDIIQQSQSLQTQFASEKPDYWNAFQHLIDTRTSELQTMGYEGANLQQIIDNEKGMIVNSCIERDNNGNMAGWKQNPAEVAYNLAMQRGYVDEATRQAQAQAAQQAQQPAQPAPREPVQVPGQQKLQMMNQGVQASRSAGAMGATANQGVMGLDQLAEMTDAQFEEFQRENPGIIDAMLGN
jgi:hypothetical protein